MTENRQSRETDNNEYRKRTQINQDNPEKLTTMGEYRKRTQIKQDNPEKLTTMGTENEDK